LGGRKNLMNTFVLIDLRLEPQQIDLEFLNWMGESEIPFVIVFTKADKLTKAQIISNVNSYIARLKEEWDEVPPFLVSSATSGQGKHEILNHIDEANTFYNSQNK